MGAAGAAAGALGEAGAGAPLAAGAAALPPYTAMAWSTPWLIGSMLCCAIPCPIAGILDTIASPSALDPVFWVCSWVATMEETPSWSKTGFLLISAVTVLLAEVVRAPADCWRVRASPRERTGEALTVVVALERVFCVFWEAVRTAVRELASVGETAWEGVSWGMVRWG